MSRYPNHNLSRLTGGNPLYNKNISPVGVTIKFTAEQELWEDLFLTVVKFITSSKHLPFDLELVKDTLIELIEEVFEETESASDSEDGEEEIPSDEEESVCKEEKDNSVEGQQKIS